MDNVKRFSKKVEELQRKADKASGALAELMKRLQEEFGCKTVKQAEKKLKELEEELEREVDAFKKALKEFEEEYGDELE